MASNQSQTFKKKTWSLTGNSFWRDVITTHAIKYKNYNAYGLTSVNAGWCLLWYIATGSSLVGSSLGCGRQCTNMDLCTVFLIGAMMLISSECRRDLKTSGFINQFKIQISGPCREEDCSQARYSYHRNSCQGNKWVARLTLIALYL